MSSTKRVASEFSDRFLTKYQLCQRLGISRPTLDRRVKAGEIPAIRPYGKGSGRIVLFDWREIRRKLYSHSA